MRKAVSEEGLQLAEVGAGACLETAVLNKELEIKAEKSKEKKGREMRITPVLPKNKTRKTQSLPEGRMSKSHPLS